MQSLMSVNSKFMIISPKEVVELIKTSTYTKGVEVCIDYENENEVKYLDELVFELNRNDMILQVHANNRLELDKQIEFMKELEKYSDLLGYPIVVTIHSVYDEDKDISLNRTVEYLTTLINSIDNEKVKICLENLNDDGDLDRLDKKDIREIVLNDERLYFTYDIGHEMADYGRITDLDQYMTEDISNIHLHTHNEAGQDHMPIFENDTYWDEIIKGLIYLKLNNYSGNIVYEYDLYFCDGNGIEERIQTYLKSIDFVSEKYQ